MNDRDSLLSAHARRAVQSRDWSTVRACAGELLARDPGSAEAHFLSGLAAKAAGQRHQAVSAFSEAVRLDASRYDAAIELADQYVTLLRHRDALDLLRRYEPRLENSPLYLDMAGTTYSRLGLHAHAWPLYEKANALQPDIEIFQANLASCAAYLGKIDLAKALYRGLLQRRPDHQRNHYELSRLETARDTSHLEQMQAVLHEGNRPADKNIFLYYAIGKELEDLGRWREAFDYYRLAGDTVTALANYDVAEDIAVIDRIMEVCNGQWLREKIAVRTAGPAPKTPIFIVGLPRTGTTLAERIISSHSLVESADESFFLPITLRRISGIEAMESMSPAAIDSAAKKDMGLLASGYLDAIEFRLGDKPLFIDKLPENFLYLGFIAKAFPEAHLVNLRRNPMDACFAMYKQSFFKFAYSLENVGKYYVAYDRLYHHWTKLLKDRLIDVQYESLVADPETEIRSLLNRLGLEFEPACLSFEQNEAPSATASSTQIREKAHTRSIGKWRNFSEQLQPLRVYLENAGIAIDSPAAPRGGC